MDAFSDKNEIFAIAAMQQSAAAAHPETGRDSHPPLHLLPDRPEVEAGGERGRPKDRAGHLEAIMFIVDWAVACMAIFVGFGLRVAQRGDWNVFYENFATEFSPALLWVFGGGTLFAWLMLLFKTYDSLNLYHLHRWAQNLLKSVLAWPVLMLAILGLTQYSILAPRLGLLYCVVALLVLLVFWRFFAFVFLLQPHVRCRASSRILVVGWNDQAAQLLRSLRHDVSQMDEFVGCVPTPGGRFATKPPPTVPVLGDYCRLPEFVQECEATSVILADVSCPAREIYHLISFCNREYLDFQLIPEYFPALTSSLQIRTVRGVPLLGIRELPLDRAFNRVLKRLMDVVGAAVGLVLAAPVIVGFGILVYLESPGPIIYRQRRTTRSGRHFDLYKIRSMAIDAEATTGAVWAKRDDPRRLKIGTFMRKCNVDELPQFWNVLKGDMSLVGPRPERPELIEKFKDEVPNYNVRHEVKAGITGWAQINGYRGDTDLRKRIEYDLHYLENWSPVLDFYCLVTTFFRRENAH